MDAVKRYVLRLREEEHSTGHIANVLWALKRFLKYLNESGRIDTVWHVSIPHVDAPDAVDFIERDELNLIIEALDAQSLNDLRMRTFIEVMTNTGLRPSEALRLTRDDVRDRKEIEIVGKGKKKRSVYFNDSVHIWVEKYLEQRTDELPNLFVVHSKTARPASLRYMENQFKQLLARAGIQKHYVLHTMRHNYSTNLLINGCPIEYVAVLLGHSKVETTRRHYIAIRQKHAKDAHFRYLVPAIQSASMV